VAREPLNLKNRTRCRLYAHVDFYRVAADPTTFAPDGSGALAWRWRYSAIRSSKTFRAARCAEV
jgi:hypothetical protein